jgi:TetR/AcrR family transcriptional regulator, cholesterol catabolism regulator
MVVKAVRQRLDPAKRSALILDKALQLFATSHYSIVTVRDIALACKINVGLIYHYFDNKDHLFRSVLAHAIGQLVAGYEQLRSGRDDDPQSVITAWLAAQVTMAPMIIRMVKIMADYAALGTRDPAVDAMIRDFYRREHRLLEDSLRRGIKAGIFRAVDIEKAARLISRQLDGIYYASASRGENRIAQDTEELTAFIWQFLRHPERVPRKPKPRSRRASGAGSRH